MSNSRILVTGAAGFIGSHLCETLIQRGYSVIGVDNLSMGRLENLAAVSDHSNFTFSKTDVSDTAEMKTLCKGVSTIVHLAAYKIPRYGKAIDTLRINALGAFSTFDAAAEHGARVILASTSDVYGRNPSLPYSEESESVFGSSKVPRWGYAVSKLFDEHLLLSYRDAFGLPATIIRIFGSYGPRHHLSWWGGPQSVFITAALNGEAMEIHGDGLQTRSFCYIDDTVDGFVRTIEAKDVDGEIINIGNADEITIHDLAVLIHELCGSSDAPNLNLIPYENFGKYEDVRRRVPDLSLAKKLLNFTPRTALREGLLKTISWQKDAL